MADEVRKLSGETETAVVKISQGIASVSEHIETQFEDKLSNVNLEKERQLLEYFSAQLNELGQNYEELMQHEAGVLAEVQSSSRQLAEMFLEAQASVQFQDVTRQQIEHVMQALVQLDEHASMLADRLRSGGGTESGYTPIAQHLETLTAAMSWNSREILMTARSSEHQERLPLPSRGSSCFKEN